jgi:hypothetical protein
MSNGSCEYPRLAFQQCRHFGLKPAQPPHNVGRSLGLLTIQLHPGQLVPAVRAQGLEFGVALQGLNSFVQPTLANQAQAQSVPGPVQRWLDSGGLNKGVFGPIQLAQPFAQESQVEPASGIARMQFHQALQRLSRCQPIAHRGQQVRPGRQRVSVIGNEVQQALDAAQRLVPASQCEQQVQPGSAHQRVASPAYRQNSTPMLRQ